MVPSIYGAASRGFTTVTFFACLRNYNMPLWKHKKSKTKKAEETLPPEESLSQAVVPVGCQEVVAVGPQEVVLASAAAGDPGQEIEIPSRMYVFMVDR